MTAQAPRFATPYGPDGTIPPGGPKTGAEGASHGTAGDYHGAASSAAAGASPDAASAARDAADRAANATTGPAAVRRIGKQIEELREAASLYVAARADAIKLNVKRSLLWAALGLTALLALAACIVTSMALVVIGISRGLARLLDGRTWLAEIATGGGLLLIIGLAMFIGLRMLLGMSRARTVRKYNERKQNKHDVGNP